MFFNFLGKVAKLFPPPPPLKKRIFLSFLFRNQVKRGGDGARASKILQLGGGDYPFTLPPPIGRPWGGGSSFFPPTFSASRGFQGRSCWYLYIYPRTFSFVFRLVLFMRQIIESFKNISKPFIKSEFQNVMKGEIYIETQ